MDGGLGVFGGVVDAQHRDAFGSSVGASDEAVDAEFVEDFRDGEVGLVQVSHFFRFLRSRRA